MAKRKLIRQSSFPYHVVTRTNNKTWFKIPMCEVWDICKESLIYAQAKESVELNSFVLMSNHYHMLITTPEENIDRFMMHFNWKLSNLISKFSGVINQKFSNRYRWTIVDNQNYLQNVYRYIYQNPVRANITKNCWSYPYSSLHFSRFEAKKFNYKPHFNYLNSKSWFEKRYSEEFENLIKKSLRKSYFQPNLKTRKFHLKLLTEPSS